jgi:hypothetical protein
MARIVDRKKYIASKQPALTPEQLNGKQKANLTMHSVDTVVITTPGEGPRDAIKVIFSEYPEHAYWPNRASSEALFEKYGDDLDAWVGQRVALVVHAAQNPRTGEMAETLWVLSAVPASSSD